jgi:hypothetical protein
MTRPKPARKLPFTISISAAALQHLEELATAAGRSRAATIERLILAATEVP